MAARPVILDCDTGTDDAVAIMLAALHPGLDLLGVTTVFGNLPVGLTTDNTLRVLDHIGRPDIGVYAGAAGPIAPRPVPPDSRELPPHLPLPAPTSTARDAAAAEWLVETIRAQAEPVTVVATGPFTNLAAALTLDPSLADAIGELVLLGGSDRIPSVTPLAERNVWNDPQAARMVLGCPRVVLVTLDATSSAPLGGDQADLLGALGTAAGTASAEMIRERLELYAAPAAPVHDPLAVAWLLDPDVVRLTPARVEVQTAPGPAYGRTHIDPAGDPNARVALHADADRFFRLLHETFG